MPTIVTALTLAVNDYPLPDIRHLHCCFLQLYYGSENSCILIALLVVNDYLFLISNISIVAFCSCTMDLKIRVYCLLTALVAVYNVQGMLQC